MFICSFLVLFCLPKKARKKKGHKLAITATNLIARPGLSTTVWPSYPFAINGAKCHGSLGGGVSSFAYILDQVRNSSTFKAFLVRQQ
ncbi:hypothetical protein COR50_02735 [Chitinophaga caeni]|uniref:Uncharacterized protein n=1 Tax=Chitinophaga caeni TaxID=2029983 RepID=A0A291QQ93_9BACT|nr:hypothetical protein COR50_02735 [Chitinophaga caeni]